MYVFNILKNCIINLKVLGQMYWGGCRINFSTLGSGICKKTEDDNVRQTLGQVVLWMKW